MSIRVAIADDHPVVRDGLRLKIERSGQDIVIVGEASDGFEVLKLADAKAVDVFILDIAMPRMNGIEAARHVLKQTPSAKVIILSLHDARVMVIEALAAGVRGYLTKETATQEVVEAIKQVHAGRTYLSPKVAPYFSDSDPASKRREKLRGAFSDALTGRERKVLQLIAEGKSNKEIAALLGRSVNTIHAHRNNIMSKLNLHKQAEIIHYAIKSGLVAF